MFNVESDCCLDKRVLRYVTFCVPGVLSGCSQLFADQFTWPLCNVHNIRPCAQSGCLLSRSCCDPREAPGLSAQRYVLADLSR